MSSGAKAERQQSKAEPQQSKAEHQHPNTQAHEHQDQPPTTSRRASPVGPFPQPQPEISLPGQSGSVDRCVDEMRVEIGDAGVDEGCRDGGSGLCKGPSFVQGCKCCARDFQWHEHLAKNAQAGAVTVIDLEGPEAESAPDIFEPATEEYARKQRMRRCITGLHEKGCLDCIKAKGKMKPHVQIHDGSKESSICFDLTGPHPKSAEGYRYALVVVYRLPNGKHLQNA